MFSIRGVRFGLCRWKKSVEKTLNYLRWRGMFTINLAYGLGEIGCITNSYHIVVMVFRWYRLFGLKYTCLRFNGDRFKRYILFVICHGERDHTCIVSVYNISPSKINLISQHRKRCDSQ
jgi:hypothetical protein